MSEEKTNRCHLTRNMSGKDQLMLKHSIEDLRLDCLRLALQRQGARDSRDLLTIAEEYYGWVTAESVRQAPDSPADLPTSRALDWKSAKEAPAQRLTLGVKTSAANSKPKGRSRQTRSASGA